MIERSSRKVLFAFVLLSGILLISCGGGGSSTPVILTPGNATLGGTVLYEDREYRSSVPAGFTGNTSLKPARFVTVEIVDVISGLVLADGTTDVAGAYNIPFTYYYNTVRVRVLSEAVLSVNHSIEVRNLSNRLYAFSSGNITVSDGASLTKDVSIAFTPGLPTGAFNILDVFASGFEFVNTLSGSYPPRLTAYWQASSCNGTYYWPGNGIYIIGGCGGDTDEYDDDVLWHELGHFIADKFSRDDSPGGIHYLTDNDLDLRLSWSEGWGDFFQGAVKYWLSTNDPGRLSTEAGTLPSTYVDTSNTSWSFDFNTIMGDPYTTAANEVAIAKVLWNLMTGTGSFGMPPVWDVFDAYLPLVSTPVNSEAFWDGWIVRRSPGVPETTTLEGIYGERKINYQADIYETDDGFARTALPIALNAIEEHYIYKSSGPDKDIIPFTAVSEQSYTAQTFNLLSGADTYLRVISPDQSTVVGSNDNAVFLESSVSFTAGFNGTYYIEVTSSANRPLSAGRYGTYSLRVTQP